MVVLPPGARTRALAVCTRGIGGARCWWGWWVLVSGAVPVVGASEVDGGAVSAAAAAVGLLLSWRHFGNRRLAVCELERRHWRRAMRSTCETERGRVGVLM